MPRSPVSSSTVSPSAHCPSCGRFVGPQQVCPYCGASVSQRLSLRFFRYGAVILALVGLALLWVAARSTEIPVTQIQDIGSTMNWAYVRLQGTVTRPPSYDAQSEYLKFWLYDGSGEIMVAAYRNESRALIELGLVPAMGDRVTVEGTLKVKEDFQSLTLNVPAHMLVERPEPDERMIGEITLADLYQKVLVRGQVREVRVPYEGLIILTIRDRSGEIAVTYTADLIRLSGAPPQVSVGDMVQVRGAVSMYGETPQISLDRADGLLRLATPVEIAEAKTIDQLGIADVERMVQIEGEVVAMSGMSAGRKLTLDDGHGQIAVVLWQNVIDALPNRADLQVGARLRVCGIVSEYKGELEVLPELPVDVEVIGAPQVEVQRFALSDLNQEQRKKTVATEGQIVRVMPFSAGQKLTLQDGTATLTLLFWQDLYQACPDRDRLQPGAWVSVQGKLDTYQGELEIIPAHPQDVVFVEMRPLPAAERRSVAEITEADVGLVYQVEGVLTAVNSFSKGQRWTLDDGSGQIVVLVWENVLAPLSMRFEVGTRVQVSGEIEVYKDTLELVPAVPGDIIWLEAALLPTLTPSPTAGVTPTPSPTTEATPTPTVTATRVPPTATPGMQILPTGKLTHDLLGQMVTIQGQIVEMIAFSSGVKFYVDDGSGRAALWMVQEVYGSLSNPAQWIVGSRVRARGVVQEYKGELEVVPQAAGEVTVLAAATPPPVSLTRLADLSAADKGKTVTVEGQIVEATPFSQGMKYTLDDGSGKIILLLWQNVYNAVPGKDRLVVGATVQATGKVDEYKGELEIVPDKGIDVVVR